MGNPFDDLNPLDGAGVTKLVDMEITRQDGVKRPASGIPFLIMKSEAVDKAVTGRGKLDEKPDIEGADHVIACIAQLIASEASELAAGYDEACDITLLVEALSLIKWFRENEVAADQQATMKSLAADSSPEGRKAFVAAAGRLMANSKEPGVADEPTPTAKDAPEGAPEPTQTPEAPAPDVDLAKQIDDKIAAAVAEVQKAAEDRIAAVKAELDTLKSTPIPGMVSLTAPPAAQAQRTNELNLAKAAYHERQASLTDDRGLASYHRQKAAELRAGVSA